MGTGQRLSVKRSSHLCNRRIVNLLSGKQPNRLFGPEPLGSQPPTKSIGFEEVGCQVELLEFTKAFPGRPQLLMAQPVVCGGSFHPVIPTTQRRPGSRTFRDDIAAATRPTAQLTADPPLRFAVFAPRLL